MRYQLSILIVALCHVSCASQKESAPMPTEESAAEDSREVDRTSAVGDAQDPDGVTSNPGVSRLTTALNAFSFDLIKNTPESNFAVSPIGVYEIGLLTLAGVENDAADELRDVLRVKDTETNLHEEFKNYRTFLEEKQMDKGRAFELWTSSQVWGTDKHEWNNDFLVVADKFHTVRPSNEPFSKHPGFGSWVSTKTVDVIPNVTIPKFPSNSQIVIGNAAYVRGAWLNPFRRGATKDATFEVAGKKKKVPFMNGASRGRVCVDKTMTLIELPFRDPVASAWIVFPEGDLSSVVSRLDASYFDWAVKNATSTDYTISVPLFHATSALNLNKTFESMGAVSVFDAKKDAWRKSVIAPNNTALTSAVAAASMRFNEHGVFGAEVKFDPGPIADDAKQFVIDRPFLVLVRDNHLGAVLLVARVDDPLKK